MAFNLNSCPSGWRAADGGGGRPDLRGMFLRGINNFGTGNRNDGKQDLAGSRSLGSYQNDTMQSHKHTDSGPTHGYYSFKSGRDGNANGDYGYARDYQGRTTNTGRANLGNPTNSGTGAGNPRHGNETRPKNVGIIFCIRN